MVMKVAKDKVISIEYTITDASGSLIDSTDDREAFSFIQGRGTIFPAIEEGLEGHALGEQLSFSLSPEQAYGQRNEQLIKQIPREQFHQNENVQAGMEYKTMKGGEEVVVTVVDVDDAKVTVDANHPLAGEALNFEVVIVGVRDAVDEELSSGEVQEMDDIYSKELSMAKKLH
jgi:FKBP-type peptidyl-prolyl cis-trans isomerase SlyD